MSNVEQNQIKAEKLEDDQVEKVQGGSIHYVNPTPTEDITEDDKKKV